MRTFRIYNEWGKYTEVHADTPEVSDRGYLGFYKKDNLGALLLTAAFVDWTNFVEVFEDSK